MATTDLGKIGITPKGAWGGGKTYERLDAVAHLGASYLALRDTGVEPGKETADWMLLAEGISTEGVEGIIDTRFEGLSAVATSGAYGDLSGVPEALPADGGDADTIDTFHASQENIAETAVVRGADGSVQVGRIISDTPITENVNISQVIVNDGADGQYKKTSLGHLKSSMGVGFFYSNSWSTNSAAYRKFMTLRSDVYNDAVTTFTVSTRGSNYRKFAVCWNDSSGDPGLRYFRCTPNFSHYNLEQAMVYIAKSSAGYWDFYVEQSSRGWDNLKVFLFHAQSYAGGAVFKDESVSTLPEGYITPTEVAYIP